MSFDKLVESVIKEARERGDFKDLPGKGKPIDLTDYFNTPEEVRVAQSVLKNAGMASREVELLKEIAELKEVLAAEADNQKQHEIRKRIQEKQVEFNLMMERQKRQRSQR